MKAERLSWASKLANITKMLLLWVMLISGIVLATRQARAVDSDSVTPVLYK